MSKNMMEPLSGDKVRVMEFAPVVLKTAEVVSVPRRDTESVKAVLLFNTPSFRIP